MSGRTARSSYNIDCRRRIAAVDIEQVHQDRKGATVSRRKGVALTIAVAVIASAAGCGDGSSGSSDPGPVPAPKAHVTEEDVMRLAQIVTNDGGLTYEHTPTGCKMAVVLLGRGTVDLYAEAGDNVASNPDRTVGVKIVDKREQECHSALTEALATVRYER